MVLWGYTERKMASSSTGRVWHFPADGMELLKHDSYLAPGDRLKNLITALLKPPAPLCKTYLLVVSQRVHIEYCEHISHFLQVVSDREVSAAAPIKWEVNWELNCGAQSIKKAMCVSRSNVSAEQIFLEKHVAVKCPFDTLLIHHTVCNIEYYRGATEGQWLAGQWLAHG